MSQHQIPLNSPRLGVVQVTVGFDATLQEAFFTYFNKQAQYASGGGLAVADLQGLCVAQLGVALPQQVLDAVHADVADLRLGAQDVNRRLFQYDADGKEVLARRW